MKHLSSYDVIQNAVISSLAFHSFAIGYYSVASKRNNKESSPHIKYFFYVLPLIYHEDSLNHFYKTNNLHVVLNSYPQIATQLQHRSNKMSKQTFDALNIAFSYGLLQFEKETLLIKLVRKTPLNNFVTSDVQRLLTGSRKLGFLFAKTPDQTLRLRLNIIL